MRRAILILGLFALASSAGCRRDRCVPTCEQRAKEVKCLRGERCKEKCEELHKATVCAAELKAFEACFLEEPVDHWLCDEESFPVVKNEYCGKQREAVVNCLQSQPIPSVPTPNPPAPKK
jgi:hypothetical protein